ncbi:DUF6506 family protein [Plantactinospora endophytica]|uniref:Uncharacterized protein n=1 Tax=Plantactinospora endophytica TaxID=673535 RepID=A0ABQ4EER4_9ACTN|nr:DUF6506 family protein [Plantactinospora endophytica]GIG93210.1 hypothetical protein Pen02_81460 [Plantactinospora endophytica]
MTEDRNFDETFIFLEPGADPDADRVVVDNGGSRAVFVWAPDGPAAARVAAELADGGVRLIELYRGFDLTAAAQVIEAVGGRAPVGVAGHLGTGPATGTRISRSATIYERPEADPGTDRVLRKHATGGWTAVVGAPDEAVARVAVELVDSGAELVEICGGAPLTTAAQVRAAVDGRVPVTLVGWPFESIDGAAAFKAAFQAGTA